MGLELAYSTGTPTYRVAASALYASRAAFCIAFPYRQDSGNASHYDPLILMTDGSDANECLRVIFNDGSINARVRFEDGTEVSTSALSAPVVGQRGTIVIRYDGTNLKIYQNAVEKKSQAVSSTSKSYNQRFHVRGPQANTRSWSFGELLYWGGASDAAIPSVAELDNWHYGLIDSDEFSVAPLIRHDTTDDSNAPNIVNSGTGGVATLEKVSGDTGVIDSDTLPYVNPLSITWSIPSSGALIRGKVRDSATNALLTPAAGTGNPTIVIDGGEPVELTEFFAVGGCYACWIIPAESRPTGGETVTISMASGVITTSSGANGPIAAATVTNSAGIELLPTGYDIPAAPIPLLGNVSWPQYYNSTGSTTVNYAMMGGEWIDADGVRVDPATLTADGVPAGTGAVSSPRPRIFVTAGWANDQAGTAYVTPGGNWTLRWRANAPGEASDLSIVAGATALDGGAISESDGVRSRRYEFTADVAAHYIQANNLGDSGISGPIELCPDEDVTKLDRGQFLNDTARLRMRGIRGMRTLDFWSANSSGLETVAELTPADYQFLNGKRTVTTASVSGISVVGGGDPYFAHAGGGTVIQVTTAAPHGWNTGKPLRMSGTGATVGGVSIDQSVGGFRSAHVIDATTINFWVVETGALSYTSGGTLTSTVIGGPSPEMLAKICEEARHDYLWLTLPHLMDEDCLHAYFARLATALPDCVREVIVEGGGNECPWNGGSAFRGQYDYAYFLVAAGYAPNANAAVAKRNNAAVLIAKEHLDPSRVKSFLGGQLVSLGVLSGKLSYAASEDYTVDYAGPATYIGVGSASVAQQKLLGVDGCIDLIATTLDPDCQTNLAAHIALIEAAGAQVAIYEGHISLTPGSDSDLYALYTGIAVHPRTYNLTLLWLIVQQQMGVDLTAKFEFDGRISTFGVWAAWNYWNQVGGYGNAANLSGDLTACESVQGQAFYDWTTKGPIAMSVLSSVRSSTPDAESGVLIGVVPDASGQLINLPVGLFGNDSLPEDAGTVYTRTGVTEADSATDMSTAGFAGSEGENLSDCANKSLVTVWGHFGAAAQYAVVKLALYDAGDNPIGFSESETITASSQRVAAAGDFIGNVVQLGTKGAAKFRVWVQTLSSGANVDIGAAAMF